MTKPFPTMFLQILFPVIFAVGLGCMFHFYQARNLNRFVLFFLLSWFSVGSAIAVFMHNNMVLESEYSGLLLPDNLPRPSGELYSSVPSDAYMFLAGTSVAWSTKLPMTVLEISGKPVISMEMVNGSIAVSVVFFDRTGKVVASLDKNEWNINSSNYFRKERPSSSKLVVYDQENNKVLNVHFMNKNTIKFTGVFFHPSLREPILIEDEYVVFPGNNRFYGFNFGQSGKSAISIGK